MDWARGKGYSPEILERTIKAQGIGPIANEFAEDVTAPQMEDRPVVIAGSGPEESGAVERPSETSVSMDKVDPREAEKTAGISSVTHVSAEESDGFEDSSGFEAGDVQGAEAGSNKTTSISPYKQLEMALEAAGEPRPPGHSGHHMVSLFDPRAEPARRILQDFDIPINSADNGVWLPRLKGESAGPGVYHPGLNTTKYHEEVYERLIEATGREEILGVLGKIKKDLSENTFPYQRESSY